MTYTTHMGFAPYFHINQVMEIKARVAERQVLNKRARSSLKQLLGRLENMILQTSAMRQSPGSMESRTELDKQVAQCQRDLLHEDQQCWQDVAKLETELRDAQRQMEMIGHDGR